MAEYESEVVAKLKDGVTCSVCFKLLEKPNTFTCVHTFCQPCLDQMQPTNQNEEAGHWCPVCRKFCKHEDAKSDTFLSKDILVNDIAINEKEMRTCSKCKVEKPKHRCLICKDNLCPSCKAFHDQFELLKVHQCVEIGEVQGGLAIDKLFFCKEHKDKPIELYCKKCKISICAICKVIHHGGHPSETTGSALQRELPQVREKKKKIQESIKEVSENLDEIKAHGLFVHNEIESTKEKVLETYEKMQKQLNNEKQDLLDQLENLDIEKQRENDSLCEKLENSIKERGQAVAWIEGTLRATSGVCLLNKLHGDLGERIKTLSNETLMCNKSHLSPIDVEFKASQNENMSMIGCLSKVQKKPQSDTPIAEKCKESHLFEFEIKNLHTHFPSLDYGAEVTVPKSEAPMAFHNFVIINGKLWLVNGVSPYIRIYNCNGALEEKKQLTGVSSPRALVPLSDTHVAIAAKSGVSVVNIHSMETRKLRKWKCSSICVSGSVLYAFNFEAGYIESFAFHSDFKGWEETEIYLDGIYTGGKDADRIIVSANSIFYSHQNANEILQYDLDGDLLKRHECTGCMDQPKLCGKDKHGMIFFCNKGDRTCNCLDPRDSSVVKLNVCVDTGHINAAPESKSLFWMQCGPRTFQRYILSE